MEKIIIKNENYSLFRNFVEEHHGYSEQDFKDHPEIKIKYNEFMDKLIELNNKRVEINFSAEMDFISLVGNKKGRIKYQDKKVKFYEGKKTKRFYYLDAGLYEGFFAILVPKEIQILN